MKVDTLKQLTKIALKNFRNSLSNSLTKCYLFGIKNDNFCRGTITEQHCGQTDCFRSEGWINYITHEVFYKSYKESYESVKSVKFH